MMSDFFCFITDRATTVLTLYLNNFIMPGQFSVRTLQLLVAPCIHSQNLYISFVQRLVLVLLLSSAQLAVAFAPPRRFNAVTIAKASRCETGASVFASRRDVLSGLGIAAGWIGGTAAWAAEEDEANAAPEPVYNDIPLSREKVGCLLATVFC